MTINGTPDKFVLLLAFAEIGVHRVHLQTDCNKHIPVNQRQRIIIIMMNDDNDHSWSVDGGESSDGDNHRPYGMDSIEQEKAEEAAVAEITKRETRGVQMWRVFTIFTLVAVSVAVSTITFRLLQNKDVDEFEDSVSVDIHFTPHLATTRSLTL